MYIKRTFTILLVAIFSNSLAQNTKVIPCSTYEYTKEVSEKDPKFIVNQELLELETQAFIKSMASNPNKSSSAVKIIPIVFHVFHNGGAENIPREKILEQVEILNKDLNRLNADTTNTNPIYKAIAANCQMEFRLAKIDPNGNCTDGIVRFQTTETFNADNPIKALSAWPNNKYFNIWVVETITTSQAGTVLGRSQFPGGANNTDGVLLKSTVCGNNTNYSNFGRTLTHEIGHSFNLRHIWGDTNCGSDLVNDTPPHATSNDGCPQNRVSSCVSGNVIEMVENYMDYTNGSCQNMFSNGQNVRIQGTLNSTINGRNNLWSPANLIATGTNDGYVAPNCVAKADFARPQEVCSGISMQFKDGSYRAEVTNWEWTFEGGTPATSQLRDPLVTYNNGGRFSVKLKVSNTGGSDSIIKTNYMRVFESVATVVPPFTQDMENQGSVDSVIYNISGNTLNWESNTASGYNSAKSIKMPFYGVSDGQENSFLLPAINLLGTTNPVMKYRVAYAQRTSTSADRLSFGATRNCGKTYTYLSNKSGAGLASAPMTGSAFVPNSTTQWRQDSVALSAYTNEDNAIFRFRATNGGTAGNNIYIDNIEISVATGIDNLIYNNLNLLLSPNPTENATNLTFNLIKEANVGLRIVDVLGRVVLTINEEKTLQSGQHTIRINAEELSLENGIYFVSMNINGMQKTERLLISK